MSRKRDEPDMRQLKFEILERFLLIVCLSVRNRE